ncbi:serine O-acetyltransferase [Cycloclasticus pugetii]|uniref:serine O-acetyltransferase n=1 Tax=Cycloclasticus pugetii TaxID=34068 RepID=UPI00036B0BAF|nr:serine O-acetyltransferase [Cycloclasticus pugetii]
MKYFFDDLTVYREGLLAQGFWALQIYRFGHARFKYTSKFIRLPWGAIHLFLSKLSEIFFGIHIGVKAEIGRRLVIEHFGSIVIHGASSIGDDCVIRQEVTIGNRQMSSPLEAPIIGSNVNIGAGAKILGQVTIGDNVDIGANAVVISNVPTLHIAVGVPAIIKPKKS